MKLRLNNKALILSKAFNIQYKEMQTILDNTTHKHNKVSSTIEEIWNNPKLRLEQKVYCIFQLGRHAGKTDTIIELKQAIDGVGNEAFKQIMLRSELMKNTDVKTQSGVEIV